MVHIRREAVHQFFRIPSSTCDLAVKREIYFSNTLIKTNYFKKILVKLSGDKIENKNTVGKHLSKLKKKKKNCGLLGLKVMLFRIRKHRYNRLYTCGSLRVCLQGQIRQSKYIYKNFKQHPERLLI